MHDRTDRSAEAPVSRRNFLAHAGAVGLGITALGALTVARPAEARGPSHDALIVTAATTAEALATTMYTNIIASPLYSTGLNGNANDQAYLVAGLQQELDHYNLLVSAGGATLATTFYFPVGMFGSGTANYQTTLNTLVTLEDAFIAAYLIGIRDLSAASLRVLAGQIMGVESEHRVFGRVVATDLGLLSVTGLSGKAEMIAGPTYAANNLSYERRFAPPLNTIQDVVGALGPFVDPTQAKSAGFSTTGYAFPKTLTLPAGVSPVMLASETP